MARENPGEMEEDKMEPIAVIGMACHFSGEASSPEKFWEMISSGRTGHGEAPKDRFDADAWYHPFHERRGAIQTKHGFFLEENIAVFDAPFFSITAKEAAGMDPMQRKLLEVSYESFENAGISMASLAESSTSVYAGVMTNDYERLSAGEIYDLPHHAASGTSRAMLSNRVSWFYNLKGPSLTLDTACSSSLYAFHLACQSIRTHESEQALVMGANLILHPNFISQLSSMHMLSPDGVSHSFDSRANGYARGDAIAGVVLKPLSTAIRDGNTIRAIVRGTGVNQDGKTPGITMPSGEAQAMLIKQTYEAAGLPLDSTMYFESHGTGTFIGDPIELGAIGQSFGVNRSEDAPLLHVGSVKTNVGHTEGAAGLAGLIKAIFALESGLIPPNANLEAINPRLKLQDWKITLPVELTPWPTPGPRRASVNSFGFGGSNAHAILDDAYHYLRDKHLPGKHITFAGDEPDSDSGLSMGSTEDSHEESDYSRQLLVFSSQDQSGIKRIGEIFSTFLEKKSPKIDRYLQNLAYTLNAHRTMFDFRSFAVVSNLTDAVTKVLSLPKARRVVRNDNIALIFTGQGAQWPAMGRELLSNPVFLNSILRGQACLDSLGCKWKIIDLICDTESRNIDIPEYCQPVCTALQLALVDLLKYWRIVPKATVGHSSGEIGAAYAAGGISHESAMKIAYFRGIYVFEIQKRLADRKGAMLAAGLTETEALEYIQKIDDGTIVVGCVNSPTSVTLSGDLHTIEKIETIMKADSKFARKLRVGVAYHSPHMEVVAQDFLISLGLVETKDKFDIPMFSSVSTEIIESPSNLNAAYWVKNMVSTVRFSAAVEKLINHSVSNERGRLKQVEWTAIIEVGPHETLKGPVSEIIKSVNTKLAKSVTYTSLVRRGMDASLTTKEAAGILWSLGHSIDIAKVNGHDAKDDYMCLVDLPSYPWKHSKEFWHEPSTSISMLRRKEPRTDLLGIQVDNFNPLEPQWHNFLQLNENPWMEDHAITGTVLYPAAGMLIMVLEAALKIGQNLSEKTITGVDFQDVRFERGLVIPAIEDAIETSLSVKPHESRKGWFRWTIFSLPPGGQWIKHSYGLFSISYDSLPESLTDIQRQAYDGFKQRAIELIEPSKFYDQLKEIGMNYGPLFTNVIEAAAVPGSHSGWASIQIPDTKSIMPEGYEFPHIIHPATLDAIFHLIFIALYGGKPMSAASVPVSIDDIFIATDMPTGSEARFVGFAEAAKGTSREATGDIFISDENWSSPKVWVQGMIVREVSSDSLSIGSTDEITQPPKRTANLEWLEDIDFLVGTHGKHVLKAGIIEQHTSNTPEAYRQMIFWTKRLCHKSKNLRTLIIASAGFYEFAHIFNQFVPEFGSHGRFADCTILVNSEDQLATARRAFDAENESMHYHYANLDNMEHEQIQELGVFDLVYTSIEPSHAKPAFTKIHSLLHQGSYLVIVNNDIGISASKNWLHSIESQTKTINSLLIENPTADLIVQSMPHLGESQNPPPTLPELYLLDYAEVSKKQLQRRQKSIAKLEALGFVVHVIPFLEDTNFEGKSIISLLELEQPLVIKWTEKELSLFKNLVFSANYLLWLTHGGILDRGEASLDFAPTTGLLRTVRTELSQITLPHLDISPATDINGLEIWDTILRVLKLTLSSDTLNVSAGVENEFAEFEGKLFIPRAVTDRDMDTEFELHSKHVRPKNDRLYQNGRHLKLDLADPERPSSLRWITDESPLRPLDDEHIEIQIANTMLYNSDADSKSQETPGIFNRRIVAGTIVDVGSSLTEFHRGDLVITFTSNAFRTRIRQHQKLIRKVPNHITLDAATSSMKSFITAYRTLVQIARLQAGETILIHGGQKLLMEAMLQIQKSLNPEFITNVLISTNDNRIKEALEINFGLPEQCFLDSNDKNLASKILEKTDGRGLDVIARCGPALPLRYLARCLKSDARLIFVNGPPEAADLEQVANRRNVSVSTVDIDSLDEALCASLIHGVNEMLEKQLLQPLTNIPTVSVSQLHGTIQGLRKEFYEDEILINFDLDAVVPVLPKPPPALVLESSATYILAGGLGALGLTIAQDMVKYGARHLVLLSRSGATQERQISALKSLQDQGCRVDPIACDITDEVQVHALVERGRSEGWIVRGVVQCAMVLRDAILQNMTIEKWETAIKPKITGTWNLHTHLPKDMSFFIVLSSMSGIIGNTAQSNYAAGNAFEDAFALYRHSHGLTGTTLNIGLVTDASHFTASATVEDYLKKYGHWNSATVSDHEMRVALAAAMRGKTTSGKATASQILVGITDKVPRDSRTAWAADAKFNHRVELPRSSGDAAEKSVTDLIVAAENAEEIEAIIEMALKGNVAMAMTADPDDIDARQPIYSFGVDSLKAIEVRNWIFKELKCDISVFTILSPAPLSKLATTIAGKSTLVPEHLKKGLKVDE